MWKMWKSLKKDTRIAICNGIAFIALIAFLISAAGIDAETSAPFWCAVASLGALSFFGWLAGWLE
jgi:hypothetical protein